MRIQAIFIGYQQLLDTPSQALVNVPFEGSGLTTRIYNPTEHEIMNVEDMVRAEIPAPYYASAR